MNRADKAHGLSGFITDGLGTFAQDANLAVRAQDPVLHIDLRRSVLGARVRFRNSIPVVRVNVLEIFRVRPGLSPGLESKNSPAFIRPSHLIGFEIEHPAADMRDALCLYELIVTLAQRLIRYCPFDRSGN